MARSNTNKESIEDVLTRGVEQIIEPDSLRKKLESGKELRIKLGIDPTAPNMHLGHSAVLRKLRQFQDLGHKVVLIIGDFTARIGDPSGREEARQSLSEAEIKKNMKKYLEQAGKIIDIKKAEIRKNSEWYGKAGMELAMELSTTASVQQVLKRKDFKNRIDSGADVAMVEALYPVMQGYDSVVVEADAELGGADQLLNLLMGRKVQRHYDHPEQDIITIPLLEGLDGKKKMSKSVGNTIDLTDNPDDMFGKTMSVPDDLIVKYFELATDEPVERIDKVKKNIKKGENPKKFKMELALAITAIFHGKSKAEKAKEKWEKLFSEKDADVENIPELRAPKEISVLDLTMLSGVPESKSEAKRLIKQGGVRLNDEQHKDFSAKVSVKSGDILKIGKKNFFRIKAK